MYVPRFRLKRERGAPGEPIAFGIVVYFDAHAAGIAFGFWFWVFTLAFQWKADPNE